VFVYLYCKSFYVHYKLNKYHIKQLHTYSTWSVTNIIIVSNVLLLKYMATSLSSAILYETKRSAQIRVVLSLLVITRYLTSDFELPPFHLNCVVVFSSN